MTFFTFLPLQHSLLRGEGWEKVLVFMLRNALAGHKGSKSNFGWGEEGLKKSQKTIKT